MDKMPDELWIHPGSYYAHDLKLHPKDLSYIRADLWRRQWLVVLIIQDCLLVIGGLILGLIAGQI